MKILPPRLGLPLNEPRWLRPWLGWDWSHDGDTLTLYWRGEARLAIEWLSSRP